MTQSRIKASLLIVFLLILFYRRKRTSCEGKIYLQSSQCTLLCQYWEVQWQWMRSWFYWQMVRPCGKRPFEMGILCWFENTFAVWFKRFCNSISEICIYAYRSAIQYDKDLSSCGNDVRKGEASQRDSLKIYKTCETFHSISYSVEEYFCWGYTHPTRYKINAVFDKETGKRLKNELLEIS